MMNEHISQYLHNLRQRYYHAREQVNRHWKKGVVIAVVIFIVLKKDIDIDLNLNGPIGGSSPESLLPGFWESAGAFFSRSAPAESGAGYYAFDAPTPVNTSMLGEPAPASPRRRRSAETDDNLANTFSNLTFSSGDFATSEDARARAEKKRKQEAYVKRYADIARHEMDTYGIPASISLAQGLLESNAGESSLATRNNNHFGIKCFSRSCRKGHCSNFTDDHHKDFFRIYRSPSESYRAHSLLLRARRYRHLFNLDAADYEGWAYGLKKAGYATDKRYAEKLINLIEELDLRRYDR